MGSGPVALRRLSGLRWSLVRPPEGAVRGGRRRHNGKQDQSKAANSFHEIAPVGCSSSDPQELGGATALLQCRSPVDPMLNRHSRRCPGGAERSIPYGYRTGTRTALSLRAEDFYSPVKLEVRMTGVCLPISSHSTRAKRSSVHQ